MISYPVNSEIFSSISYDVDQLLLKFTLKNDTLVFAYHHVPSTMIVFLMFSETFDDTFTALIHGAHRVEIIA